MIELIKCNNFTEIYHEVNIKVKNGWELVGPVQMVSNGFNGEVYLATVSNKEEYNKEWIYEEYKKIQEENKKNDCCCCEAGRTG
jgi:small nuclear ribonucleoprotein (snRNP)-like protein